LHGSNPEPLMSALGQKQTSRHLATLAKGTSVILVLNQYNCIGCSPNAPTLELWQLLQMKTVVVACTTVVYALLFSRVSGCQDEIGIACVECSSTQGQGHC
jgi:hypothetical protein